MARNRNDSNSMDIPQMVDRNGDTIYWHGDGKHEDEPRSWGSQFAESGDDDPQLRGIEPDAEDSGW